MNIDPLYVRTPDMESPENWIGTDRERIGCILDILVDCTEPTYDGSKDTGSRRGLIEDLRQAITEENKEPLKMWFIKTCNELDLVFTDYFAQQSSLKEIWVPLFLVNEDHRDVYCGERPILSFSKKELGKERYQKYINLCNLIKGNWLFQKSNINSKGYK